MANISQICSPNTSLKCDLAQWGLPPLVVAWFRKKGITSLFQWQAECLCKDDVLFGGNLVYCAPTSAGKTLVADFLLLKRVLEYGKKALVIEPFVALTREKAATLKSMLFTTNARVGAFGGNYYTPGGMTAVRVAVCTIEKANNFINKLINEDKLSDIGIIVVDEIHFVGDERRGHQLELLLTKVIFHNSKQERNKRIQIVGLSATIPNLRTIAIWLNASLYITDYRPVPLIEKIKIGNRIYQAKSYLENPECDPIEIIEPSSLAIDKDVDNLYYLCIGTIIQGHSVLVFCESKRECEVMALGLAEQIKISGNMLSSDNPDKVSMSESLRKHLTAVKIKDVLRKLNKCPAGPDTDLVKALKFGVGFHHAGLTSEEREIVEDAFKGGAIKALLATSTLSSGVNLPARKVIIKSPMMISGNSGTFQREMLNPITYRQMIGRAGRKNIDTCGESILICRPENQEVAIKLLNASLGNIHSSLAQRLLAAEGEPSGLKKAVLEVIANGTAITRYHLNKYLKSTFWLSSEENDEDIVFKNAITETLRFLVSKKFIEELKPGTFKATRLGTAVLNSGLHPDESLELLQDLLRARQGFCLLNDLHIIYQVTPNDIARTVELKDWQHYSKIWNNLDDICQYVGERVGIDEIVIARRAQGFSNVLSDEKERVYRRFWVALVVNDLVSEMQLYEICSKYRMSKATVQQVQRGVAQFAGVMSIFCHELGYDNIAALVTPLECRINFSCQRDLLDLVRLNITRPIARVLFNAGYKNVITVAKGEPLEIEFVIRQLQPFKKEQSFTEADSPSMWIPELAKNMSTLDYASHIVDTARSYVEIEYDIDITSILDKKRDEDQTQRAAVQGTNEASPIKRARLDNGDELTTTTTTPPPPLPLTTEMTNSTKSDYIEPDGEQRPQVAMVKTNEVPNFVIHYVGRSVRDIDQYLDNWINHADISLNFKLEQQVSEPIGAKIKKRPGSVKKKRRKSGSQRDGPSTSSMGSSQDELNLNSDDGVISSSSQSGASQDFGLPLRLDIDRIKYSVTKMYTCFGSDLTVHIIDSSQTLRRVKNKLAERLQDMLVANSPQSSDQDHDHDEGKSRNQVSVKTLYTQNIAMTYKVLYAAFNIDQVTLTRNFLWHGFDVAWWMINNCPNRGVNNINSSLSMVANTKWASNYHHFLHPSSGGTKKSRSSKLVPNISECQLGRTLDEHNRLRDVVKSGKTAILQPLIRELLDELSQRSQLIAYQKAEIPSRLTMAQMMVHGIGLEMKFMRDELTLYEDLSQQLTDIAQKYYAKSSICLSNIKQVARVLYEDLNLKQYLHNHSTNSDISKDPTNGEILKLLVKYHPFPQLVIDYRKIGKALEALQAVGTYARHNSELNMMRVFGQCDFWQLTGRVAMVDPNLFLINRNFTVTLPAHGNRQLELVECAPRRCFVPLPGWQFVAADYSQLELRLLAHFSGDESLLEILNRSLDSDKTFDVFRTVASRVYQKPLDQVTKEHRQHAKQICYGIIYGMGNRSLANQLGVDVERAQVFRQDFFSAFPGIGEFTSQQIEQCERDGYVMSLLGRRRTIDGINAKTSRSSSSLSAAKSRAQRVAVNTRIQSSASDIIKLAMKTVNEMVLNNFQTNARLTLEMHDELIYEVNPQVMDQFASALKKIMEEVSSNQELKVKLLVNLKRGPNWSCMEDFNPISN